MNKFLLLVSLGFGFILLFVGGLIMKVLLTADKTPPGRAYWTRFYDNW